jgi:hypothetical protein
LEGIDQANHPSEKLSDFNVFSLPLSYESPNDFNFASEVDFVSKLLVYKAGEIIHEHFALIIFSCVAFPVYMRCSIHSVPFDEYNLIKNNFTFHIL